MFLIPKDPFFLRSGLINGCWKEQSAQQHGAVWTTGNHLPAVYTSMES